MPAYIVAELDASVELEEATRSEDVRRLIEQDRVRKDGEQGLV